MSTYNHLGWKNAKDLLAHTGDLEKVASRLKGLPDGVHAAEATGEIVRRMKDIKDQYERAVAGLAPYVVPLQEVWDKVELADSGRDSEELTESTRAALAAYNRRVKEEPSLDVTHEYVHGDMCLKCREHRSEWRERLPQA
jgi:hypothetical protein